MLCSCNVKSISDITANASETPEDVRRFDDNQQTQALLKRLALGEQEIATGRTRSVADVVSRLRESTAKPSSSATGRRPRGRPRRAG
jgi:hypothetical protein